MQTVVKEPFEDEQSLICFFCGGASCSKQDYTKNKLPNAIEGLHSSWITPHIIAMQRPSTRLIKTFKLPFVFKSLGINTILNLQQPGEHSRCGDPLELSSGFSYLPSDFEAQGIRFFNYHWPDMTSPPVDYLFKILDVFQHSIHEGGKIAVHCHAGTGRTVLAIAAWLLYANRMRASQVISMLQTKREGVLSRQRQRQTIRQLESYLTGIRSSFFNKNYDYVAFTNRMYQVTLGPLKRKSKYCSTLINLLLECLKIQIKKKSVNPHQIVIGFISPARTGPAWSQINQEVCSSLLLKLSWLQYSGISKTLDHRIYTQTLIDSFDLLSQPVLRPNDLQLLLSKYQAPLQQFFKNAPLIINVSIERMYLLFKFVKFMAKYCSSVSNELQGEMLYKLLFILSKKKQDYELLYKERTLNSKSVLGSGGIKLVNLFQRLIQECMYLLRKKDELKFIKFEMLALGVNLKFHLKGRDVGSLTQKQKAQVCWKALQPAYCSM